VIRGVPSKLPSNRAPKSRCSRFGIVSRGVLGLLLLGALVACRQTRPAVQGALGSQERSTRPEAKADGSLTFGALSANLKVRPADHPTVRPKARLFAARNEFEAVQLVVRASGGGVRDVSLALEQPLTHADGAAIPPGNVLLYRVGYYRVGQPSNIEGASGRWPDALIPHRDSYTGELRNAFPFDVPDGETRVVWLDLLVPPDSPAGAYRGQIAVTAGGNRLGAIPIELKVGRFALPSTPSLKTAYGMQPAQPCMAHTGTESCSRSWSDTKACTLRARYVRAALDNRLTLSGVTFQAPLDGNAKPFEQLLLPLVRGTGRTRLAGARATSMQIRAGARDALRWLRYGRGVGIADRMFWLAADEPQGDASKWEEVKTAGRGLREQTGAGKILVVSPIADARRFGAEQQVDIFVPALSALDQRGDTPPEQRRSAYDDWQEQRPGREVWGYVPCMSYACLGQRTASFEREQRGWPSRRIDSSAVQNRAFGWLAFIHRLSGEFGHDVAHRLDTAWEPDGQAATEGAGGGTLFYPGKPEIVGGKTDIPIESIRLKLIREGIEDFEYLRLAAHIDAEQTRSIAQQLFPRASQCNQSAAKLEQARAQLFDLLDRSASAP
jgi:hypothetical protein